MPTEKQPQKEILELGEGNQIVFIRNKRTGEMKEGSLKELFE